VLSLNPPVPSVGLTKSVSPTTAPQLIPGADLVYTIAFGNTGTGAAALFVVTDPIPANTTVVSLTGSAGWTCTTAPAPPACTIATLGTGATANFTFLVTVNTGVASGTTITQTDSVTSTADPNGGNSSASFTSTVVQGPDLVVTTTVTPGTTSIGVPATITYTVTNVSTTNSATNR